MAARLGSGGIRVALALAIASAVCAPRATADIPTVTGAPTALTVDDMAAPIGIGANDVFFGWHLADPRPGAVQSAYRIVVTRPTLAGSSRGATASVWDSGKVPSPSEAFVPYNGPALSPDTTYRWTVQTWDGAGVAGPVAPATTFDTGLGDGDWHADWIKRLTVEPDDSATMFSLQSNFGLWENKDEYTYVRKEAALGRSPIVRARVYLSADQQYELYVNGVMAGKGQAYQFPDSQYYETQDVTGLLKAGATNAFGILYNWQGPGKGRPAGTPGVIAHISVLHQDGSSEVITTDGTWRVLPGAWLPGTQRDEEGDPVDYTENISGPAEPTGWDRPGYVNEAWAPATVIGPHPVAPWTHLVPVRTRIVYEPVHAVSLHTLPSGAVIADFGKVYAGIPQVAFHHGVPGHAVTMRAGFLLDGGSVSTTHGTQHTDMSYSYIQRGGSETFRPFDYLAFRYLQIDDPGEVLSAGDVTMLIRHTAVPDEHGGTFSSSDPTVDAVYDLGTHSALFTMQEQFVDTPTREKGSWLGDGRNESEAAMAAFGDVNLTRKDLLEFAQSQARYWPNGAINKIYPTSLGAQEIPEGTEMYPEWVWEYWMHTGDRAALTTLLPVVTKVAGFLWSYVDRSDGLLTNIAGASDGFQFPTDTALNVLAVNVFDRVADMAAALGRPESDAAVQRQRAAALTAAINAHLVAADGTYLDGLDAKGAPVTTSPTSLNAFSRQSVNAYALQFGVVPPARAALVARSVAQGNMSTPPIFAGDLLQALRLAGDDQTILHLLTDGREPGWANILARGGTFGWEVWNPVDNDVPAGGTPAGSFFGNGDSMSHGFSSNVVVAIQEALLGVTPTAPGFATFDVAPPAHVLTHAEGTVPTPYGPIAVRWSRPATAGGRFELDVSVPPGTTATVHIPMPGRLAMTSVASQDATIAIGAGAHHLTSSGPLTREERRAASSPMAGAVIGPVMPASPSAQHPGGLPARAALHRTAETQTGWATGLALASLAGSALLWARRWRSAA